MTQGRGSPVMFRVTKNMISLPLAGRITKIPLTTEPYRLRRYVYVHAFSVNCGYPTLSIYFLARLSHTNAMSVEQVKPNHVCVCVCFMDAPSDPTTRTVAIHVYTLAIRVGPVPIPPGTFTVLETTPESESRSPI